MFCSLIFDKHPFIDVSQRSVGAASTIYMAPLNLALATWRWKPINCLLTHEKTFENSARGELICK
jgi:hypothetical protein